MAARKSSKLGVSHSKLRASKPGCIPLASFESTVAHKVLFNENIDAHILRAINICRYTNALDLTWHVCLALPACSSLNATCTVIHIYFSRIWHI
jgi:hypothetical protein